MNDKELPVIDQLLDELQSAGVFATALLNNVHDFHHYKEKARPIIAKYLAPSVALDKLDSSSPVGRYRKKPVVIEAVRWEGHNWDDVYLWCPMAKEARGTAIVIPTLEGDVLANAGTWIIKGVKGEFYPCQPDIFAATYEPESVPAGQPDTSLTEAIREKIGEWRKLGDGEERFLCNVCDELVELLSQAGCSAGMGEEGEAKHAN